MSTKELIEDAKAAGLLHIPESCKDKPLEQPTLGTMEKLAKLVELQRQRERQAVPSGWKLVPWHYTTLFNAIAAATKSQQKGVAVEISVKAFQEAMLSAAPSPELISPHPIVEELTKE
jgi:hypothetical protein